MPQAVNRIVRSCVVFFLQIPGGFISGIKRKKSWVAAGFGPGRSVKIFDQVFPGTSFSLVFPYMSVISGKKGILNT